LVVSVLNRIVTVETVTMTEVCAMDFHYSLLYLSALSGNRVVVGDLLRSCTLVEFHANAERRGWSEVCRDEESAGLLTAMSAREDEIFCAFDDGRISVLQDMAPFGDRRLEIVASVMMEDRVNAFVTLPGKQISVFPCASGRIGALVKLSGDARNFEHIKAVEEAVVGELDESEKSLLTSPSVARADLIAPAWKSDSASLVRVAQAARITTTDLQEALRVVKQVTSIANY
jgi:hypothetical protein